MAARMCHRDDVCFYCDQRIQAVHEHDHFPVAKRHGGTDTVATCVECHNLKDRHPLNKWPVELVLEAFRECGPLGRLLLAKTSAIFADFQQDRAAEQERAA